MRYLHLIFRLWRQSLMREMAYAKNFWFLVVVQIGWFAVQIFTIEIIFSHTSALGGWSKGEAMALLTIFTMVLGILRLFFETSFTQFCSDVHDGSFDFALARPVDPRLFLSFRRLTLEWTGMILFNVGFLLFLLLRGEIHVTLLSILGFLPLLFFALVIGYCLWFALTLFIFWTPTIEQFNYLYTTVASVVRFPLDIYGKVARRIFLSLLPIGFLAAIPTEFLLGMGKWIGILFSFFVATIVVWLTRIWWRFALKRYASASS